MTDAAVPIAAPRLVALGGCPVCGSTKAASLFTMRDRLVHTPGEYRYRRCASCATAFQDPRVIAEDLGICYPASYYRLRDRPSASATAASGVAASRRLGTVRDLVRHHVRLAARGTPADGLGGLIGRALARVPALRCRAFYGELHDELVPRTVHPGRALDVGCSTGEIVSALAAAGWDAEGLEWDAGVAEIARQRTLRPIRSGDILTADLPNGSYELVVLQHVLEHVPDPVAVLRRVAALLARDGRATLFFPNSQSLGARCFGSDWYEWDPPRHLCLPSLGALGLLARRAGLVVVRASSTAWRAATIYAASRAVRSGRALDRERPRVARRDRLLAAADALLAALGFGVGEEITLIVRRER